MRLLNSILAVGAFVSSVYAGLPVDKRGTYQTGVDITGYASQPTQSPGAMGATTHDVWVGGTAGLVYSPEFIMASVGDVVTFHFAPKNHTLTQSTFDAPCAVMAGGTASSFWFNHRNGFWV